ICLILGTIISVFLSKISFILYLSAWIVFTLYSVPPMRLKHRGIWGILADSLGANVFPQLFAVSVLFDWFGQITDFRWFGLIGIWSFLLGLRGIVSHQMTDKKNDQIAGVQTFVQNLKNKNIKKFFNWIIFPIEMGFLILILYYSNNFWGFGLLVFYFIVVLLMRAIWEINFRSVISSPKERMLMNEFYFLLYPISYLIAGLTFFVSSGIVFILHLVGFYPSIKKFFFELKNLLSEIKLIIREFILGY
ncbi:MAG TPA: UbiA family prenyltransferase, partial [Pyrinomonadaceae bacterium]|nr:UbiA family prenyltransferase [Pyrinomonadaceae bacterium]